LTVEVYAANPAAAAFYARCGFVATGRKERDDQGRPLPLVVMEQAVAGSAAAASWEATER
jgi:putative acetyltransferase